MRTLLIGVMTSLLALIGVASDADAAATIDLIWAASGTNDTAIATSSSAVLRVILTNEVQNIGASVSIDYSDASDQYSFVTASNMNIGEPPGILTLSLAGIVDIGSSIVRLDKTALPPYIGTGLAAGQSFLLATITFHKFGAGGSRTVSAFLGPDDAIAAGVGGDGALLESQMTLGSATLIGGGDPCGNNILDAGEDCDDGNIADGDCCSAICEFEPIGSPCNDGDACTTPDTCNGAGSCNPGAALVCDDSNLCTDDSCNPASGCLFANNTAACDDNDACTTPDACSGGSCQSPPLDCDDFIPCTSDGCDMVTGCFNEPIEGCGVSIPSASDGGRVLLLAAIMLMAGIGLGHFSRSAKAR